MLVAKQKQPNDFKKEYSSGLLCKHLKDILHYNIGDGNSLVVKTVDWMTSA